MTSNSVATDNQLKELDDALNHLEDDHWGKAVINNPRNTREIFLIGHREQANIFIYNKSTHTLKQSKVDLTTLQQNGVKINPSEIYKVEAAHSSNKDHIVVAISYNFKLYYAMFDCKSYQWLNFSEETNFIDQFTVAHGVRTKNNAFVEQVTYRLGAKMIAVKNYLIFTGAGHYCNNMYILDVSDELAPVIIHRSQMNQTYGWHGCVELPTSESAYNNDDINANYNSTSVKLLVFGRSLPFSSSVFKVKITFTSLKKLESGPKHTVLISKLDNTDGGKYINDKYIDLNGNNIEITIEYNPVAWKCNDDDGDDDISIFDTNWHKFSYEWQNQWSDWIIGLNKNNKISLSKYPTSGKEYDYSYEDEKHNEHASTDTSSSYDSPQTKNINDRYLAVFGGQYWDDKNQRKYPNTIVIFDTYNSEWYLSKHKLPSPVHRKWCFQSLMDENGLLYLYGCHGIRVLDVEINLADHEYLLDKNYIGMHKVQDICFFFRKFLSKRNLSSRCQQLLAALWKLARDDSNTLTAAMVSKCVRRDYLIKNIRFLIDCDWWGLSDIELLKALVGIWHVNKNEFDSDELALIHDACEYNNGKLLMCLIKNKICNESNVNTKNNLTGNTCLDVIFKNDSDECIDILMQEFGDDLEAALKLEQVTSATKQINAFASTNLAIFKFYNNNGVNWDGPDEEGLSIIHHILQHKNTKTLKYVIENGICLIDKKFIDLICEEFPDCIKMLSDSIASGVYYTIKQSVIQHVILRDADRILHALLESMLKRQGIENFESYRDNTFVTFEFILNLFKLCEYTSNCANMLKLWSQKIVKYNIKTSNCKKTHRSDVTSITNNRVCILCLKAISPTTAQTSTKITGEYDYCPCYDYFVCQNCKKLKQV